MAEFLDFASKRELSLGPKSVTLAAVEWLDSLRSRGGTAPGAAFHALILYNEVLELHWNLAHPSIKVDKRDHRWRSRRRAPTVPFEFLAKLDAIASSKDQNSGLRLFCSMFLLMIHAASRFADTLEILTIERTKTVLRGRSVDQKDPTGPLIAWAAQREGITSKGAWINPLLGYWEKYKPAKDEYRYLFPYFSTKWEPKYSRPAIDGVMHYPGVEKSWGPRNF